MAGKDNKKMIITFFKNTTTNNHEQTRTTKKNQSTSSWCLCGLWLILLLLSCKSAPKIPDAASLGKNIPLESGASVYLIADVKEAGKLISLLPVKELNDSQTKQMLERTDFLAAAIYPKESGRRFQIAAWGDYPSSGADVAFSVSKSWKKMQAAAKYSYWYSEDNKLSIAMYSKQAFAAASVNDTPIEPVTAAPGVNMPEGFAEFRGNSPFSCWFIDGAAVINRILNSLKLPIRFPVQEFFLVFFPAEEGKYYASIRMCFENESQARGMASLFTLANNYIFGELGGKSLLTSIFFANKPVQNEKDLDIKSAVLSEAEIAQLFQLINMN